jgi:hypothetical protein
MIKAHRVAMNEDLLRLLADVARAELFYQTLSPQPSQLQQLCDLESLGYIRYCSYPEEFWIVLPAGKALLSNSERRSS